jgi:hypothetical protein
MAIQSALADSLVRGRFKKCLSSTSGRLTHQNPPKKPQRKQNTDRSGRGRNQSRPNVQQASKNTNASRLSTAAATLTRIREQTQKPQCKNHRQALSPALPSETGPDSAAAAAELVASIASPPPPPPPPAAASAMNRPTRCKLQARKK